MTATTTTKHTISPERMCWLSTEAIKEWENRDTGDLHHDREEWFNTTMKSHADVHNILGGTRYETQVNLSVLSDKAIMGMVEQGDDDYRDSFRELSWLIGVLDRKIHDELFDDGRSSYWPEWIFTGKVKSGTKATKILSRCVARGEKLFKVDPKAIMDHCPFTNKSVYVNGFIKASTCISKIGQIKTDIAKFREESEPLTVAIIAEPHHFLKMGYHHEVDTGSCFKSGSEYELAPFVISYHARSVMFYVKRGDNIIGRAWGGLFKDCAISTNIYPNVDTSTKSMVRGAINAALSELYSNLWEDGLKTRKTEITGASNIVYQNGDAKCHAPIDPDFTMPDFVMCGDMIDRESDNSVGYCENCERDLYDGDDYTFMDHGRVCQECLDENYTYIEARGTYIHQDDAIYDDIDDVSIEAGDAVDLICGKWTHRNNATELYNGDWGLHRNTVQLEWGPHCDDYAHKDDEDLTYRDADSNTDEDDQYHGEYGWGIA